jgi:predicted GNAT family N-acyltransferase
MIEIVRVTTQAQLQECLYIRQQVFVEEQKVPVELEIDEKDDSPRSSHHMLLIVEGHPAAASRWYAYNEETAKLQRIAVLMEYRDKGLGKRLVTAMEEQARELGLSYAMLDGQCQVETFYHKLGYVTLSEEPFDDAGIPHVRMKKRI